MATSRIAWLLWIQMLPIGLVLLDRVANWPDFESVWVSGQRSKN